MRSFKLPTALTERMNRTPSDASAQMLARAGISDGRMRCPTPWRGKNAMRVPSNVPSTIASDGAPNGVSISTSSMSVRPSIL